MVNVYFEPSFEKMIRKIKYNSTKEKLKKQIAKIIENPEIGKPMQFGRKGTREVYVAPFRLSYLYLKEDKKMIFSTRMNSKKVNSSF